MQEDLKRLPEELKRLSDVIHKDETPKTEVFYDVDLDFLSIGDVVLTRCYIESIDDRYGHVNVRMNSGAVWSFKDVTTNDIVEAIRKALNSDESNTWLS